MLFYLQAGDGCTDCRNQLFKREIRGGEKTQISTRSKSGNTFKILISYTQLTQDIEDGNS